MNAKPDTFKNLKNGLKISWDCNHWRKMRKSKRLQCLPKYKMKTEERNLKMVNQNILNIRRNTKKYTMNINNIPINLKNRKFIKY